MPSLTLRVDLGAGRIIGPGKVQILELIDEIGSIAGAGRAMEMSYRRAWLLVDEMNRIFRDPVILTQHGGSAGGGAKLTATGRQIIDEYRAIQREAHEAVLPRLDRLMQLSTPPEK